MAEDTCSVEGCVGPSKKRGMCGAHYQRVWKYGSPHRVKRGEIHAICTVDGCEAAPRSYTADLCEMHYYRRRRHGDPAIVVDTRRDEIAYRSAHSRLTRDLGPASGRACIDCGRQAHHWSYRHDDPNERTSPGGQPYSLNPASYEPRCAPCHAIFDGTGANQYTNEPA